MDAAERAVNSYVKLCLPPRVKNKGKILGLFEAVGFLDPHQNLPVARPSHTFTVYVTFKLTNTSRALGRHVLGPNVSYKI